MMCRFAQPVCAILAVPAVLALAQPAIADDACPGAIAQEGMLAAAAPDGDLVLRDGRVLRLTQIEPLPTSSWQRAFAGLKPDQALRFHILSEMPDRWGRWQARVVAVGGDAAGWLERQIVLSGEAVVRPEAAGADCITALLLAEREAQAARAGAWGKEGAFLSADRPAEILAQAGTFAVVEGRVLSVGERSARTYLNFGRTWKTDLTVTLSKRILASVALKGLTAATLRGRLVRVRGIVEDRDGPAIDIARPEEIELIGLSERETGR